LISRRRLLQAAAALGGAGILAAADGLLFEPNSPRVVRIDIPLARLPVEFDGLTIAQLSDFHYDDHFTIHPITTAVRVVNELHPDLVVLTGDYVSSPVFADTHQQAIPGAWAAAPCARLLGRLSARLGVFAALGNHDVFTDAEHVERSLREAGLSVLRNQALPLQQHGARIWLAGLDDAMEGKPDPEATLRRIPPQEAVIALVHEPDWADEMCRHAVDLQLSGHSHGGQVRLPLYGALYLPDMALKYPMGLRTVNRLKLYTNVGIGTIRIPVRFDCPPEITLVRLRAEKLKQ
jgi:predicted MPP superfamily phosphohydrolase